MKRNNSTLGGILVLIGALLLVAKYMFNSSFLSLGPDDYWPMIVLVIGVGFELSYFIPLKAPGLLVPGGILTTCGLLFFFETMTNWHFSAYTWPVYILSVAIGLFQLYLYTGKPKGLLIAIGILGGIAAASLLIIIFSVFLKIVDISVVIPAILVLGGLFMLFGRNHQKTGNW
jgi:hypothetical protein